MDRKLLGALLMAAIFAGTSKASAADLAIRPVYQTTVVPAEYSWTGFYLGENVGYGWNTSDGDPSCSDNFGVINGVGCQIVPGGHVSASGFFGGGQAGYNLQMGQYVLGSETDFQGSAIAGSTTVNGPFAFVGLPGAALPAGNAPYSERLNWFGTARLRVGYAVMNRVLVYGTGGLAFGRAALASNFFAFNVGTSYPANAGLTKLGWAVGGGVDYALATNWTARIEGLYLDLGQATTIGNEVPLTFPPLGFSQSKNFDLRYGLVRFGLNYRP